MLFRSPLVGREMEYEGLRRFLMNEEAPPVLQLVGATGSGRSRLLREACAEAADHGVAIYLATADPSGLSSPYYPVKSVAATVLALPPICPYDALGDAHVGALGGRFADHHRRGVQLFEVLDDRQGLAQVASIVELQYRELAARVASQVLR